VFDSLPGAMNVAMRKLAVLALLGMLSVAAAERSLLAHKPNGGGLHGVLVYSGPSTSTQPWPPTITASTNSLTVPSYTYVTNGNGSWTTGASNLAMANAIAAVGTVPGGTGIYGVGGQMTGINSVVFASSKLGVAVGAGLSSGTVATSTYAVVVPSSATITPVTASPGTAFSSGGGGNPISLTTTGSGNYYVYGPLTEGAYSQGANSAIGLTYLPTILLTFDMGASWVAATGFAPIVPVAYGLPTGTQTPPTITGQTTNVPLIQAVPDLTSVFFAGRTGWAVGGFLGAVQGATAGSVSNGPSYGAIYMTTNGGLDWTAITSHQPYTTASLSKLVSSSSWSTIQTLLGQTVAGALMSVQSCSTGKYVYAVGAAPASAAFSYTSGALVTTWTEAAYGTILFSANSGLTWAMQTPPVLTSGGSVQPYGLIDVAVAKGTSAIAVGGNLVNPRGTFSFPSGLLIQSGSGTMSGSPSVGSPATALLATTNGGFSWSQMTFPSGLAAFTSSAYNNKTWWVGGYVSFSGSNTCTYATTGSAGSYTTTYTCTVTPSFNLISSTSGTTFTQVPASALPASMAPAPWTFTVSNAAAGAAQATLGSYSAITTAGYSYPTAGTLDVAGIVWDNNKHGWVYGQGFVLATQNGGATWYAETPVGIVTGGSANNQVWALASVPTTY